jgi:hypothetical protein
MPPFYQTFYLPPVDQKVLDEFGQLPLDPYTGARQRYRRFSQYRIWNRQVDGEDHWNLDLLPHRPFLQPKSVNTLVGGKPRELEPLRIDPSAQIDAAARQIGLSPDHDWQINVHQCRVLARPGDDAVSVPEGPHRDGHDFGMLAVFARHNITGGETQLMPLGGGEPFFRVTLQPNQAVAFDDTAMWHTATNLTALNGDDGYRDLWIVVFNRWDRMKYGPEYESRAASAGGSGLSDSRKRRDPPPDPYLRFHCTGSGGLTAGRDPDLPDVHVRLRGPRRGLRRLALPGPGLCL